MSIFGALFTGVSGLRAQGSSMGMISDNIANVNTVGYKATRSKFSTMVTTPASTTVYSPGGVQAEVFRDIDRQGLLQGTASLSDIAVAGRGYFPVAGTVNASGAVPSGTERLFTRSGSFTIDQRGYLVNSAGQTLLGVPTDTTGKPLISAPRLAQLTPVNVGTLTGIAAATTALAVGANLPATDSASGLTTGLTLSGKLPTYGSAAAIAAAEDPTGTGAGVIDIGMTLLGDDGAGGIRPIPYIVRLTPTSTGGGTTTTYTASSPIPPNLANVGTATGDIVIDNTTGAVNSSTIAIAASGAVADPNSTTGGTVTVGAIANTAITTTGLSGSSTLTALTTTALATPAGAGTNDPATRDIASVVYDSLGVAHVVTLRYTKLPSNTGMGGTWQAALQSMTLLGSGAPSTTTPLPQNLGIIDFNQNGTIASTTPQLTAPGLLMSATGAADFNPTLSFGTPDAANGLTQFDDTFAVAFTDQDGVPFGYRTGVSIDAEGVVRAVFDNGAEVPLFKIPLATFSNPNGLEPRSGNLYGSTNASGDPVLNFAGIGGAGAVSPATLEASTVDLAEEFTNMIITQRAYSASAKTITTADEMLDELVRIKR